MSLRTLSVEQAQILRNEGALLVDIREPHEFNAEHIVGSLTHPLSSLPKAIDGQGHPVIFYCKSGMRTNAAANKLSVLVSDLAYVLTGGIDAWKRSGGLVSGGEKTAVAGATVFSWLLSALRPK